MGDPGPAAVTAIPDTGHHPHLTHPSAIAAIMRRLADAPIRPSSPQANH